MLRKFLQICIWPAWAFFCQQLSRPSLRYSGYFSAWRDVFAYSEREKMVRQAMRFAFFSKLEGDYLEFGVARGGNFVSAFFFAKICNLTAMQFYAFDSFAGLPKITGIDAQGFRQFEEKAFACALDEFRAIIKSKGVDLRRVQLVSGWYDTSLNSETKQKLALKKAAVIWVDCDLYESTVPVLNFITDYLQDGTILIFDDWFCFRGRPDRGERKAFQEWLACNPDISYSQFATFGWHGNSFIIHKKENLVV